MKKIAFTLAEVLITLAIIGVVSALVIPSVLKNYNDKKYNTARLKALKTFGEAGKMASINDEMNGQANATDFVNNVLSKYLKITKVCDNAHPNDCGFPSQIQPSNPSAAKKAVNASSFVKWNQIGNACTSAQISSPISDDTMSTIISTVDGYSAKIFYNPKCIRNMREVIKLTGNFSVCNNDIACINIIYDMNGLKGPNHAGEDIGFVTVFLSGLKTISIAPGLIPHNEAQSIYDEGSKTYENAQMACLNAGTGNNQYKLPNVYEMQSVIINSALSSASATYDWTTTPIEGRPGWIWQVCGNTSTTYRSALGNRAWCVRR